MARQIVVEVVGDASGLARATQQATQHVSKFNSFVTGIAQGVGQQAYGAVVGAIDTVISKVEESGQVFRDDQASIALLTQALHNNVPGWNGNTTAIEAMVTKMGTLGFQADEVRNAFGQLTGYTHDVNKALKMQAEAADFARAHHMDLGTATTDLIKIQEGNVKVLKQYGIAIVPVTAAVDALHASHKKITPEMLAAAKAADKAATEVAGYKAAMAQATGAADIYAGTSAGKVDAAAARNTASWVKIGKIVDQVSQVVIPLLADALGHVADAVGPMADALGKFFQSKDVQDFWAQVQPVLKQLGDELGKDLPPMFKAIGEVVKIVMPVVGAIFKIWLTVVVAEIRGLIVVIGAVVQVIRGIAIVVSQVVPAVVGGFNAMVAAVTAMPGRISSSAAHMWDGIKNSFRAVLNAIIGMWNHLEFKLPKIDAGPIHTPSFDLKVPQIPYFHEGGTVPGAPGTDVLAMLQAGETVHKAGSGSAGTTININIGTYVGDASTLSKMLAKELRLTGVALK